jgi:hypothetical protein
LFIGSSLHRPEDETDSDDSNPDGDDSDEHYRSARAWQAARLRDE